MNNNVEHKFPVHQAAVSNVLINEYHHELVSLNGRTVGLEEPWIAFVASTSKLLEQIYKRFPDWKPNPARLDAMIRRLESGKTVDAPVFYAVNGHKDAIGPLDGRHRIVALSALGAEAIVVMIPESQQEIFASYAG